MNAVFTIKGPSPKTRRLPILLSCPHSGTELPKDIAAEMDKEAASTLPDTDWFVDELYGFAPELGITMITANYSRFVIDLNRDPKGQLLYHDGRRETGLVPFSTFGGTKLYLRNEPDQTEVQRRLETYFLPYHREVERLLSGYVRDFGHALFFDAHSIKRIVPSIRAAALPDMILGDQQGQTAAPALSNAALSSLRQGGFNVTHNDPFMGGYLTRHFGSPSRGVQALQLEMSQDIYMNETARTRDQTKQTRVAKTLRTTLEALAATLEHLA